MITCRVCGEHAVSVLIDCGRMPICHRYVAEGASPEQYPLNLGQCTNCGLLQLIDSIDADSLIPRYEWIVYREPEHHLDAVVQTICGLPGISRDSVICGLSEKDDSTLARLNRRGYSRTWRVSLSEDLGATETGSGIESVQKRLTPDRIPYLHDHHQPPDIVIARHVLEHAQDFKGFMMALRQLVRSTGYVLFEIPDFTQALESRNYATIWEEHLFYFTAETFKKSLEHGGFSVVRYEDHHNPYEGSLVCLARPRESQVVPRIADHTLKKELQRAGDYARVFAPAKGKIRQRLEAVRLGGGKIAMYGTGHSGCMYINLMEVGRLLEFVVDDDSLKHDYMMPGSRLPIRSADALIEDGIGLCLLSLSPESESAVVGRNRSFIVNGGVFESIFPASNLAKGA